MSGYGIKAAFAITTPGIPPGEPGDANSKLSVHATDVGGPKSEALDARLIELTGRRFRRLGRFIQLAMVGAVEAAKAAKVALPAERTGIFLATGLGNLSDLLPFSHAMFGDPGFHPSAIQFANSVGNAGAFYIAQALDVTGPVVALSQDEVSFEAALLQACVLLDSGDVDLALVGSVDMVMPPVQDHLARMGYGREEARARNLKLSEGSAWWVLGPSAAGDLGTLEALSLEHQDDLEPLLASLDGGSVALTGAAWRAAERLPAARRRDWDVGTVYTHGALAPTLFLQEPGPPGERLHVLSRTQEGLTGRVTVRRAGDSG